jgi:hypothetical protein
LKRRAWPAVLAGVAGGAAAGAADATATLIRGVGGVTGMHAWRLALAAVGAGALAGALVAAVAACLVWLARNPDRGAALAAVALGGPFVVYDAFAMFTGAKAARVPAHGAVSVVLALAGLAALVLLARAFARRLDRRWPPGALVLVLVAAACYWANRYVLPRLYPWFHLTLTAVYLAAAVLAARLALGEGGGRPRRWALAGLAGAALLFGWQLPHLLWSPIVRYAAHERTQLTGALCGCCPRRARRSSPGSPPTSPSRSSLCPRAPTAPTPTSSSSPSTRSGPTTSAPTAIPAPPRPTSTPWPGGACASSGPTPRRRTPPSPSPRC